MNSPLTPTIVPSAKMQTPAVSATAEFRALLFEELSNIYDRHGVGADLYRRLLKICDERFQPVFGGLEVRMGAKTLIEHLAPPTTLGSEHKQRTDDIVERISTNLLMDGKERPHQIVMINGQKYSLLTVPFRDLNSQDTYGGVILGFQTKKPDELKRFFQEMTVAAEVVAQLKGSPEKPRSIAGQPTPIGKPTTKATVTADAGTSLPTATSSSEHPTYRALSKAGELQSTTEMAFVLANSLCNRFRCEQVGFAVTKRETYKLLAVSGTATLKLNSPGIIALRQAMGECLDQRTPILFQANPEGEPRRQFPLHRRWSIEAGGSAVCSIPLMLQDSTVGVVSLRRDASFPFTAEDLKQIEASVSPYAGALQLLDQAKRTLREHIRDKCCDTLARNTAPLRLLMLLLGGILCAWFAFGTMSYKPSCAARTIPAHVRHFSAPFEGRIERVLIAPGDQVTAGQKLVQFETRALELELASIEAQISSLGVGVRQALQEGDIDLSATTESQIVALAAQARILRYKIACATITAPADGIILQCEVLKKEGATLPLGEPVAQFAPLDGWNLEVEIPDHIAAYIEPGQTGQFVAFSHPEHKHEFSLLRVDGSAIAKQGRTVFVAEAALAGHDQALRSGMNGLARISTVDKPVWWVTFHELIDTVRLKFWW